MYHLDTQIKVEQATESGQALLDAVESAPTSPAEFVVVDSAAAPVQLDDAGAPSSPAAAPVQPEDAAPGPSQPEAVDNDVKNQLIFSKNRIFVKCGYVAFSRIDCTPITFMLCLESKDSKKRRRELMKRAERKAAGVPEPPKKKRKVKCRFIVKSDVAHKEMGKRRAKRVSQRLVVMQLINTRNMPCMIYHFPSLFLFRKHEWNDTKNTS